MTVAQTLSGYGDALGAARAFCATMTRSYRFEPDPRLAQLVLIHGGTGWVEVACAQLRRDGVVVVVLDPCDPGIAAAHDLAMLDDGRAQRLFFSEAAAANPALAPWRDALPNDCTAITLHAVAPEPAATLLLEQWRIVRALGIITERIVDRQDSLAGSMITARGCLNGISVVLRAVAVCAHAMEARHRIESFAPGGIAMLSLPRGDDARPAHGSITDGHGRRSLPTFYEATHRATLRALARGDAPAASLTAFLEDASLSRDPAR